jgi:hypothetical protein
VPSLAALLLLVVALALAPQASGRAATTERRCGTDGRTVPRAVDVRARGVGCRTARRLARRWFGAAYQGDDRRRIYDGLERRWICGVRAGSGRIVECGYGRSTVTFRLREAASGSGGDVT